MYHNQYRAMFVFSCRVDITERLRFPRKDQKKQNFMKKKKEQRLKRQRQQEAQNGSDEVIETSGEVMQDLSCENVDPETEKKNASPHVQNAASRGQETGEVVTPGSSISATVESCSDNVSCSPTPKSSLSRGDENEEFFHPVRCKICNTKVAVYDQEEVYHFFNVVTSY